MPPASFSVADWLLEILGRLSRDQKIGLAILIDSIIVVIASTLVLLASPNQALAGELSKPLLQLILVAGSSWLFLISGLYRAVVRFIGGRTLRTAALAGFGSGLLYAAIAQWQTPALPTWHFLIYSFILIVGMITVRLAMRGLLSVRGASHSIEPVIVMGAGRAGSQLVRALRGGQAFRPVAFIDDDRQKIGAIVGGIKVHSREGLEKLILKTHATRIFLAIPNLPREIKREIISFIAPHNLRVQSVPRFDDLLSGRSAIDALEEIAIEDILGRDPVPPDLSLLGGLLEGRSILVSGAGGSIGSELCRQIAMLKPKKVILFELSEYALYALERDLRAYDVEFIPVLGSVLNRAHLLSVLRNHGVEVLYHAAAYKHVPLVEANPCIGAVNNVMGTLTALEAARDAGVQRFTLVSTDKAVNPTNVMGATKRVAELVVQAQAVVNSGLMRCSMVRFGNVLGSSGSVFPLFRAQIASGGPLTVTHPDVTRFFMTIPEAAQLVLQASAMADGGEVFVLDMGDSVKIADLAKRLVQLSGLTYKETADETGEIEIRYTGLRPGEKLYEELLIGDDVLPSSHPRVMRALERHIPWNELAPKLRELEGACNAGNEKILRSVLASLVEGFPEQPVIHR